MGAPKLKWTSEEESALQAGVVKYGTGKWRTILKDLEFAACLTALSNVDLKDKWHNLMSSLTPGGQGSKTPRQKPLAPVPISSAAPQSSATRCLIFCLHEGNLASVYYEQGQMDLAIMHYKQAITLDSTFVEAYNNLGNALKDAGRVDEAIACYQSCLQLQANHPQALTNLENIYMEWNMISAAANFYNATLAVTTGLSAPYSNLAIIYKQQGHYAEAIAWYNEVLRIDPMAADGLVNRGNTLKEIGRVSEAIQDYIRAVTVRPTMAEGHANLASAYKDSGHVSKACRLVSLIYSMGKPHRVPLDLTMPGYDDLQPKQARSMGLKTWECCTLELEALAIFLYAGVDHKTA